MNGIRKNMKACLIISGGDYDDTCLKVTAAPEGTAVYCNAKKNAGETDEAYGFVIACDRGYHHAIRMGILPDVLVSDFDSFDGEVDESVIVERHPSAKNDTDTMLAVKYALEHGYEKIDIICGLGGRADHTFANYQTGVYAAGRGAEISFLSADTRIYFLAGNGVNTLELDPVKGYGLSVFSMTEKCKGLVLRNVAYETEGIELTHDAAELTGESNEFSDEGKSAFISLETGTLMVMICRK